VVGGSGPDVQRLDAALNESGYATRFVVAEEEADVFLNVSGDTCDLIVAQRTWRRLPARRLLELLRTRRIDLPVIVLSDGHTEEELVAVMRAGARDCLGKDGLGRLGACVERELREAGERRAAAPRRDAEPEDGYRLLVEEIPALIYVAWADDLGSRAYLGP
jgi:DNA-binding response OmpR family regulator